MKKLWHSERGLRWRTPVMALAETDQLLDPNDPYTYTVRRLTWMSYDTFEGGICRMDARADRPTIDMTKATDTNSSTLMIASATCRTWWSAPAPPRWASSPIRTCATRCRS
jgi:hypothetical protein